MQIFLVFSAYHLSFSMKSLGYKNHKSCKILPKFLPTLHFLQESYKFVRKSQFLQDWYIAQYFLQNSCKNFAKFAYFIQKFLQNLRFSFLIISILGNCNISAFSCFLQLLNFLRQKLQFLSETCKIYAIFVRF